MSTRQPDNVVALDRDRDRDRERDREVRELLDRVRLEVHALGHEVARIERVVRGLDHAR